MSAFQKESTSRMAIWGQIIAFLLLGSVAGATLIWTIGGMAGLWPTLALTLLLTDGTVWPNVGLYVQGAVAALALALLMFLPSTLRVLRLEHSHRAFDLTMEDVAQAYSMAHAADRADAFQMRSEFDAVRERMIYMRNHPDLAGLEPGVIDVAAQMSEVSRDLAGVYSDDTMQRAKTFLHQRQEELHRFHAQVVKARRVTDEVRRWSAQIETEETACNAALEALKDDLNAVLPALGLKAIKSSKPAKPTPAKDETPAQVTGENVVSMAQSKTSTAAE